MTHSTPGRSPRPYRRSASNSARCSGSSAVLEQLQVPLAQVREHLGIAGMDAATARNFRDKAQMKSVLRAAGVPCARHRLADSGGRSGGFAQEVGFPLVVKPPAGAGAKRTFRLDDAR